ncbi:hypothetical protein E2C01_051515 [Portunus trituberculatus]|uniref:Uncharacterized protein n=1 Tax=Portunus trituberculatus TaxID=210409 RepID=A0A5B7GJC3_PORTR|nr:hypothetical protein [Portunus trituberculatus]
MILEYPLIHLSPFSISDKRSCLLIFSMHLLSYTSLLDRLFLIYPLCAWFERGS